MKTLLCAIAKCENNYLREWVEYNLNIGFDKIVLYDNNDLDGEHFEDVIGDYIESGVVDTYNLRGQSGTVCFCEGCYSIQIEAYNMCYGKYKNDYDWFLFCDIDEFVTFENHTNVKDYLSQDIFNDYNNIKLCWKYYDDNGLVRVENGNYSIKRFTHHSDFTYENKLIKSFVRGGLDVYLNSAHGFALNRLHSEDNAKIIKACNAVGKADTMEQALIKAETVHSGAWVNHYRYKTIEEFLTTKQQRGWPDNYDNVVKLNLDLFFCGNKKTDEKLKYVDEFEKALFVKKYGEKKVIVLVTSTNKDKYLEEENVIRTTWGRKCKENGMKLFFYRGGYDKNEIEDDVIKLTSNDTLEGTHQKFIDVLNLISKMDFDYIIKTNMSIYLNADNIRKFIYEYAEKDKIYGGDVLFNGQTKLIPFFRGNFFLFSKDIAKVFLTACDENKKDYFYDDTGLASVLYRYYLKKGERYFKMLRTIEHVSDGFNKDELLPKYRNAYFIRCKHAKDYQTSIKLIQLLDDIFTKNKIEPILKKPEIVDVFETPYGTLYL